VLAALLNGRVTAEEALARGLMAVDGPEVALSAMRTPIMAALAKPEQRAEAAGDMIPVSAEATD